MTARKSGPAPVALLLSLFVWFGLAGAAMAGEANIAVASNFTATAKKIATSFKNDTGHKAVLIFGSTGKLYAQIYSGAPFDVLLAADQKRPQKAVREGLAVADSRFTYAIGKIVLYSQDPKLVDANADVLMGNEFTRLAIANPATAPYGAAAKEILTKLELYEKLAPKIVRGDNAAQTYQFVMTGNAQLGFIALSQVIDNQSGSRSIVPNQLYSPIRQDVVLLKHGADNETAKAFLHYLNSPKARAIIEKSGYDLEK